MEAEVARRLAEKEKEWQDEQQKRLQADLEARAAAAEAEESRRSRTPEKDMSLPSGVLTPILKKHRDLDDELKQRLQELEKKLYVASHPFPCTPLFSMRLRLYFPLVRSMR